jgi:S-disulfanyl-L-cysteine oxidoreductase SoxD
MTPSSRVPSALLVVASLLFLGTLLTAGGATSQPQDPKSILDRIYSVAQAERGEMRFKVSCSSCHTPGEFAGGAFAERWSGQTMGEVFDFVSNAMPENDPGGLNPEEYASVLAFILRMNGYPVGSDDMPADKDALGKFAIVANPK